MLFEPLVVQGSITKLTQPCAVAEVVQDALRVQSACFSPLMLVAQNRSHQQLGVAKSRVQIVPDNRTDFVTSKRCTLGGMFQFFTRRWPGYSPVHREPSIAGLYAGRSSGLRRSQEGSACAARLPNTVRSQEYPPVFKPKRGDLLTRGGVFCAPLSQVEELLGVVV